MINNCSDLGLLIVLQVVHNDKSGGYFSKWDINSQNDMRKKAAFLQVHTTQYQNQMLQELPLVIIDDLMGHTFIGNKKQKPG